MAWHWDINDDGGLDVWDHEGSQVATNREWSQTWDSYPSEVLEVVRNAMDGDQPSAYNQSALAAAATGDIERGDPHQS